MVNCSIVSHSCRLMSRCPRQELVFIDVVRNDLRLVVTATIESDMKTPESFHPSARLPRAASCSGLDGFSFDFDFSVTVTKPHRNPAGLHPRLKEDL